MGKSGDLELVFIVSNTVLHDHRYMPTGFSYNLDPNYGPVSMMSEEGKMSQQQQPQGQIKEERIKESSSPNEYAKMGPQVWG